MCFGLIMILVFLSWDRGQPVRMITNACSLADRLSAIPGRFQYFSIYIQSHKSVMSKRRRFYC